MKKKNVLSLLLMGCAIAASGFFFLNQPDNDNTLSLGSNVPSSSAQQPVSNSEIVDMGSDGKMMAAVQGEDIINENFRIRVTSSSVSKRINHLNKIDPYYYLADEPVVDENNTFLDAHLYVEVGMEIENLSDKSELLSLMNFPLIWEGRLKNGDLGMPTIDLSLTDIDGLDLSKKDTYMSMMEPNEKRSIYLGYVITEDKYLNAEKTFFLMPDINGSSSMNPETVYRIKLDIEEDF